MTIRTRSGSSYNFAVRDSKVYFKKENKTAVVVLEGVVLAMTGLSVGDHLKIDYLPVKNNTQSEDMHFIETTTIVSIE